MRAQSRHRPTHTRDTSPRPLTLPAAPRRAQIVDYWKESMPKVSSYNGVAALLGDNEAEANDVPDSPPHRRRGGSKIERTSSFEDPDGAQQP